MTDSQNLLAEYVQTGSDAAFGELVRRYVDLVYSTALRRVEGDTHRAEDVAQTVFVDLARTARTLSNEVKLGGWLHRHTCFVAAHTLRGERRRQSRERQAVEMNALQSDSETDYARVAPILDEAINELGEADRTAILLRFFEQHDFRSVGQALGSNEDAARMRVSRALDKLEGLLKQRGVTASAATLSGVLAANAIQAAPVGLVATISSAAALVGTTLSTTATATATKTIVMTVLQKTIIVATIAATVGTGIYEARQASTLRSQVQTLQQQQVPLAEQLMGLKTENERLSNLVAQARVPQALPSAQFSELLKLRGKSALAQADSRELAQLKSTIAQQVGKIPDFLTNSVASGLSWAEKWQQKNALARLARMKTMLNLTADQEQAIGTILSNSIVRQLQLTQDLLIGKSDPEQQKAGLKDVEGEIKALFTREQLEAYPEYERAEKLTAAQTAAEIDSSSIARDFNLSKEQQDKLLSLFYELNLKETPSALKVSQGGNLADAMSLGYELNKWQMEEKLKVLEDFLSPEQLTTYRKARTEVLDMEDSAAKRIRLLLKPAGNSQ